MNAYLKTAVLASTLIALSACSTGPSEHAQIVALQTQITTLSQELGVRNEQPKIAELQKQIEDLSQQVKTLAAQPTAAERTQMCTSAQAAAMARMAKIETVPVAAAGETLSDYRENLRVRQALIDLQIHTAKVACDAAFRASAPVAPAP